MRTRNGIDTAIVPAELEGPLDRAVRALFRVPAGGPSAEQAPSWGVARAWIVGGKVRVAGELALAPTARVRAGAELSLDPRAPNPRSVRLSDDSIVYVDAHLVVVAKPAGLSTVPYESAEPADLDTLDARVRQWLHRSSRSAREGGREGGRGRPNLGVVHRLDKETSGLVVFTRTWVAKQGLAQQFRRHTVMRRYWALAHGDVSSRTLDTFLVDNRGDGLRGSARGRPPPGARRAITHVERLESLGPATLITCRLETGRTHQIRIHLSEAGHPLLGERVYVRGWRGPLLDAPRLMLHAGELGFVHPATGLEVHWSLPVPGDMRAVADRLREVSAPSAS